MLMAWRRDMAVVYGVPWRQRRDDGVLSNGGVPETNSGFRRNGVCMTAAAPLSVVIVAFIKLALACWANK